MDFAFGDLLKMLAIRRLAVLGRRFQKFFLADPAVLICNFFNCRNLDTLAVFDHLHKLACFDKAIHRAGVEPSKTTTKEFHVEFALVEIRLVEVGYL